MSEANGKGDTLARVADLFRRAECPDTALEVERGEFSPADALRELRTMKGTSPREADLRAALEALVATAPTDLAHATTTIADLRAHVDALRADIATLTSERTSTQATLDEALAIQSQIWDAVGGQRDGESLVDAVRRVVRSAKLDRANLEKASVELDELREPRAEVSPSATYASFVTEADRAALPKPSVVKADQWWACHYEDYGTGVPFRVDRTNEIAAFGRSIAGVNHSGMLNAMLTDPRWRYLGNGERPIEAETKEANTMKHPTLGPVQRWCDAKGRDILVLEREKRVVDPAHDLIVLMPFGQRRLARTGDEAPSDWALVSAGPVKEANAVEQRRTGYDARAQWVSRARASERPKHEDGCGSWGDSGCAESLAQTRTVDGPTARDAVAGMLLRYGREVTADKLARGSMSPAQAIELVKARDDTPSADAACIAALEALDRGDLCGARDHVRLAAVISRVAGERDELRRERDEARAEAAALREERDELKSDLERMRGRAADLEKQRDEACKDALDAMRELRSLREELERYKAICLDNKVKGEQAAEELDALRSRIDEAEGVTLSRMREKMHGSAEPADATASRVDRWSRACAALNEKRPPFDRGYLYGMRDAFRVTDGAAHTVEAPRAEEAPPDMRIEKREDGEYLIDSGKVVNACMEKRDGSVCHYHFNGEHISTSLKHYEDGSELITARWPIAPSQDEPPSQVVAESDRIESADGSIVVEMPKDADPRAVLATVAELLGLTGADVHPLNSDETPEYIAEHAERIDESDPRHASWLRGVAAGIREGERRAAVQIPDLMRRTHDDGVVEGERRAEEAREAGRAECRCLIDEARDAERAAAKTEIERLRAVNDGWQRADYASRQALGAVVGESAREAAERVIGEAARLCAERDAAFRSGQAEMRERAAVAVDTHARAEWFDDPRDAALDRFVAELRSLPIANAPTAPAEAGEANPGGADAGAADAGESVARESDGASRAPRIGDLVEYIDDGANPAIVLDVYSNGEVKLREFDRLVIHFGVKRGTTDGTWRFRD